VSQYVLDKPAVYIILLLYIALKFGQALVKHPVCKKIAHQASPQASLKTIGIQPE